MAACWLEKDSSIEAGMQEGSPLGQYELGVVPRFQFTKADSFQFTKANINQLGKTEEETSPLCSRKELNDSNQCEQWCY